MTSWNVSRRAVLSSLLVTLAGGARAQDSGPISPERLSEDTKQLASTEFAGRGPGGPGEAKTVDYLVRQFKAAGLQPGGEKGGWTQAVPLVHYKVRPGATLEVHSGLGPRVLHLGEEAVFNTLRPVERVKFTRAPLVFVGYGVSAPERKWNDFKDVDLRGKIALILINDPDFEARDGEPVQGTFGGRAATYYARWTYKYEEAVRQGALGALLIHETPGAGYGWSTLQSGGGETYDVARKRPEREKLLLQGWIRRDDAQAVLQSAGLDLDSLKNEARSPSFRPLELKGVFLSADYRMNFRRTTSANVIGRLPGTKRPAESVMYGAHWDAYGLGPPDASGDPVRHGAVDDAIGLAGLLEIARAFQQQPPPERSVLFAAWTAEERGLLGSEYYGTHPLQPLETQVANLTMDVLQTAGPARDVVLVGHGQNELEDDLARLAATQGRTLTPDARPERGLFYRADHFSMARRGVPVVLLMGLGGGHDLVKGGREAGTRWVEDYTARCYHQPCDAWSADWDLRGAAQDVQLLYELGRELATSTRWPQWKPGSEFKSLREQSAASRPAPAPSPAQ